jgi:citrate synthase
MSVLKDRLAEQIPEMRQAVRALIAEHGDRKISDVSISQAYGGMRGVKSLVTETSALDPESGIRFRGYSIPEVQQVLPRPEGVEQVLPEGLFHLLMTGEVPTLAETEQITAAWRASEALPDHTKATLDAMPTDTHPMTQFSVGILSLQHDSIFAREYRQGIAKTELWGPMFDDTMLLLGRLPVLAAYIYRRTYKKDRHIAAGPIQLDWAANLAHMLGVETHPFKELMRLYLTIHADHEGGNVSAHTTHLVGSALSDPYLALSAGMNGLAGPLHGLANQEVMRWIVELKSKLGDEPTKAQMQEYVWDTLNSGRVVPGYGHAVLRQTDPRYMAQREFAQANLPDDENFRLVSLLYDVVPDILREHGKAKNPWPNVDAHSGCLLIHYGVDEYDFYTVLFGVSRAMGVLSSLVWDRALGLPLERPKSVTTEWLRSVIAEPVT